MVVCLFFSIIKSHFAWTRTFIMFECNFFVCNNFILDKFYVLCPCRDGDKLIFESHKSIRANLFEVYFLVGARQVCTHTFNGLWRRANMKMSHTHVITIRWPKRWIKYKSKIHTESVTNKQCLNDNNLFLTLKQWESTKARGLIDEHSSLTHTRHIHRTQRTQCICILLFEM